MFSEDFGAEIALPVSVVYPDTTWAKCNAKTREIETAVSAGGVILPCDGGGIWLKRGTPFAQNMADDDDQIRRKYINLTAEYITL